MLSPLEKLYDKALESNISIYKFHVSKTKKAACLHNDGYKAIALYKPLIESSAEEKVLLAEELGHYETGSIYLIEATYNTPFLLSAITVYLFRIKYIGEIALTVTILFAPETYVFLHNKIASSQIKKPVRGLGRFICVFVIIAILLSGNYYRTTGSLVHW